MYTLRIISKKDNTEQNHFLGLSYKRIIKELSADVFDKIQNDIGFAREVDVFGFVINHDGATFPLYSDCHHFVMTESGRTLERLN